MIMIFHLLFVTSLSAQEGVTFEYVIAPQFEQIGYFFTEGLILFRDPQTRRYGYLNQKGEVAIIPQYGQGTEFVFGRAEVRSPDLDHTWYIDKDGKFLGEAILPGAISSLERHDLHFYSGVSPFMQTLPNGSLRYGLINEHYDVILSAQYISIYPFSEGLAAFLTKDGIGFLNTQGEVIINPQDFTDIGSFSQGRCPVYLQEQGWGYIDTDGKMIIPPSYGLVYDFSEGLAPVREINSSQWYYVDQQGNKVITLSLDGYVVEHAFPFRGGRAGVNLYQKSETGQMVSVGIGLINRNGELEKEMLFKNVFSPPIDGTLALRAVEFLDSTYEVQRYGYVHPEKGLLNLEFERAYIFSEGMAAVRVNRKWGYIDVNGNWAIRPQFDAASSFRDGLARVSLNDKYGFIRLLNH